MRPAMTGEIENGRSMSVSSTFLPLNSNFPMAHASAVPTMRLNGTAMAATSKVKRIAARASGSSRAASKAPAACRNASTNTTTSGRNRKPARKRLTIAMRAIRTPSLSVVTGARMTGEERAISDIAESPPAPRLKLVDREQKDEGNREHQHGDDGSAPIVELLETDDDEKRRDLRYHRYVTRYENHRPVFTDATGEGEREA